MTIKRKLADKCLVDFVKEDFTQAEIGRMCELSRERVRVIMKEVGIPYQSILRKKRTIKRNLIAYWADKNYTARQIAKKLSLSERCVFYYAKKYDIKMISITRKYKTTMCQDLTKNKTATSGNLKGGD